MDNREVSTFLCDGRKFEIKPDIIGDFKNINFPDESFYLVIFDPPHLIKLGENSWLSIKYGKLPKYWQSELKQGFNECWRILKKGGTLLFKWNETDVPVKTVIDLFEVEPLLFNKRDKTHWIVYFKEITGCVKNMD